MAESPYTVRIDEEQADAGQFLLAATVLAGGEPVAAFRFAAALTGPIDADTFAWRPTAGGSDTERWWEEGTLLYGGQPVAAGSVEVAADDEIGHAVTVEGRLIGTSPILWTAERIT